MLSEGLRCATKQVEMSKKGEELGNEKEPL